MRLDKHLSKYLGMNAFEDSGLGYCLAFAVAMLPSIRYMEPLEKHILLCP